jgi:2-keto-4-pentenoate hydratase/2-oxohepta-3-ene-1,7-dioic acid hydratase in catechol pathway
MNSNEFHPTWPRLYGLQTPDGNKLLAGTIYCIGRNFADHAAEMQAPIPSEPLVFTKPIGSLLMGEEATVNLPAQSQDVHHEVEWVVALSKGGKHISMEQAWSHVAGWAVGIDFTARDLQAAAKKAGKPWTVSKGFDGFAPVSPFIPVSIGKKTTHQKLADQNPEFYKHLQLKLFVNGQLRQQDLLSNMLFDLPTLISHLSDLFTLRAGDIIFTGTPSGVSQVQAGDHCSACIHQPNGESLAQLDVYLEAAS